MERQSSEQLVTRKCMPCEGGVAPCSRVDAVEQLQAIPGWSLSADGQRIRKDWVVSDFMEAIRFFQDVARVSEEEQHHPDLHLSGYRNVWIEIWTHAIGGLSENDFILAAKLNRLQVAMK